ncbi:MAG: alpha/beta hydrolase [Candidatus Limnocylindrales bacterium]
MGQNTTDCSGRATTRFLDRPGGRIAYDVTGAGPLVVAVPGMGDLRSAYRALIPDVAAAGYRVATMDLRGHGESDTTFDAFDGATASSDIVALVERLDDGPAVVIGNSMTGGSAVAAAADRPDLVAGLVLTGPFVRDPSTGRLAELGFRLALLKPWGPRAWNAWYARLFTGRRPEDLEAHRARIRESLAGPGRWDAFVSTTRTSHAYAEARLDDVTAPALVVMGERDPDFGDPAAEADFVATRLDGRVLMVPNAGHYPHAEYPEVVTPEILRFLAEEARWNKADRGSADATPDA